MSEMPPPGNDVLEASLRDALRPVEPSPGFAERVLAKVAEKESRSATPAVECQLSGFAGVPAAPKQHFWREMAVWLHPHGFAGRVWATALAALVLVVVAAGWYQHESARRQAELRAGMEARDKALFALRLTGAKLAPARRALAELGIDLGARETGEIGEGNAAQ